ncbi:17392_t:CDS:1, partial [Rhizophagus irregularis]
IDVLFDDLLSDGCKATLLNYKIMHSTTVNVKEHKIPHSSVKSQKEQRSKRREGRI